MQNSGILADELRKKAELLELRFDKAKNAYFWGVRRTSWASIAYEEKNNLFSSVGIGARSANIVLRPDRLLTLHGAMCADGHFLFLTSIILSDDRSRQEIRAAVCESVTLTAKPQSRKGRDALNRPTALAVQEFTFPGVLTERYYRSTADEVYRGEVQQRALVTPKAVELRAGDLVRQGEEAPYTVRQVLDLDPYKNEYVLERSWEA